MQLGIEAAVCDVVCGLLVCRALLQLCVPDGRAPITLTLGYATWTVWQWPVLMRCGPANALEGRLSLDEVRVVIPSAGNCS